MPLCVRNALHSFRRLLTLASDAAPAVRATYFRTAARCLLNVLRHGNRSAFAPASAIDRGRCRFCARNALHSFRRLLTLTRKQAMLLPPSALHIFVLLYAPVFKMFCGHGNHFAFHASPSSLTAEDAASVRGILCIHSGSFSRKQANDAAPAVRATYFRTAARYLSKCSAGMATISLFTPRLRH